MILSFTLICAVLLDLVFGEATRFHPLIAFGHCAKKLQKYINHGSELKRFIAGIVAWAVVVLPAPIFYYWLQSVLPIFIVSAMDIYIVYWAVALNSLNQHGLQIYRPLAKNDLQKAQHYCGYIVSRDTSNLDEQAICRATTESMLENGHDAVTATLIYFVIGGAPLVIIHRLSNTLDAMWGYRTDQYASFGKFSARMDDALGFVSAKITTLLFSFVGIFTGRAVKAIINAYQQSKQYKSHNGGWVMASGATVLNVRLGGESRYFGKTVSSPQLGEGQEVSLKHIKTSLTLIKQTTLFFIVLVFLFEIFLFF